MNKIKNFIKKADLVTFALIALLGVSTVFAWTQLTRTGSGSIDPDIPAVGAEEELQPVFNPIDDTPVVAVQETFIVPIDTTHFNITTTFFDETSEDATALASSIFFFELGGGKYSHPSQGVSFTCEVDEVVGVIAPLSGTVSAIVDDDAVRGTMITIDHEEGLQTILTGVYDVAVSVGSTVNQGDTLGVTGLSRLEPDAGNVVHLEVMQSGEFINPEQVIGRTVNDL
ncbi:MAG: M23 family metallopeptidase [Defluviitaleaceae bacterium]|nr:M23 family metallopeptidase [Defluviitaleaceae bacterium]